MILVFIVLGLIIIFNLIILILILSNLKLQIDELHISNIKEKIKIHFILSIGIYAFNKIRVIKIRIDNEKISNMISSGKLDIKKIKYNKKINKEILKIIKKSEYQIESFKIYGYFSTINIVLTLIIYSMLNAIIPIIIAPKIKTDKYINNIKYLEVKENIININVSCIINIKFVNIINILYFLKKKGGIDNNGKSSNRRTYAYSNE